MISIASKRCRRRTFSAARPHVIAVNPKDQFRFGYRLWLDESTAMPLKTQLCDSRGQVIEQIFFARLDMPENIPDSDLAPTVRTDGMRWVRQGPSHDNASPALGGLPRQPIAAGIPLDGGRAPRHRVAHRRPASHLVYSDGWRRCRCSSKRSKRRCRGRRRLGRRRAPSRSRRCRASRGWVPDLPFPPSCRATKSPRWAKSPPQTVEFIAHSVRIFSARRSPAPLKHAISAVLTPRVRPVRGNVDRTCRVAGRRPGRCRSCSTSMPIPPPRCAMDTKFPCCFCRRVGVPWTPGPRGGA